MSLLDNEDDEGGTLAQTGSLTHKGVEAFHRTVAADLQQRKKAAWDAIAAHAGNFPLADQTEVRLFITPYMNDPRNINAEFAYIDGKIAVEVPVEFTLPPHPLDPTNAPIYVEGTADQIRIRNRIRYVDDLKTGRKTGWEMIHDYAIQFAAYCHGVRTKYGLTDCQPGNVIRAHGYRTKNVTSDSPDGVFIALPYDYDDVEWILENVRLHVALIRMGQVTFGPGPHCTYCEFGGLSGCINQFKNVQLQEQLGIRK